MDWAGWPTAEQWSALWGYVAAAGTSATVAVAIVAAVLALRQLGAAQEAAREQSRPYVVVAVVPSEASSNMLNFRVENLGLTAAYGVEIEIDPPFERSELIESHPFMKAVFLQRPIPSMAPRFAMSIFMDTASSRRAQDDLMLFRSVVTYRDATGHSYRDEYELDLDLLNHSLSVPVYGMHHIAKSLRGIAKKMGVTSF